MAHHCGIDNYYFGSLSPTHDFTIPGNPTDLFAFMTELGAFLTKVQETGEATAKGATAGNCPAKCKYKHSFIAARIRDVRWRLATKNVRGRRIQYWEATAALDWIANVTCNDKGPSTDPDTSAPYDQIFEWMPEDKRIQAIADQKHLYGG